MKKLWLLFIFIFLFILQIPLYKEIKYENVSLDNLVKNKEIQSIDLLHYNVNQWEITSLQNNNTWVSTPLELPYIDYSKEGLIVNYQDEGNQIVFYYYGKLLQTIENTPLYPRITFPFVLLISSDRTYVQVYKLVENKLEYILEYYTKNIITSYNSSPDGKSLVIGMLSNEILSIRLEEDNKKQPSINTFSLPLNKAVIYGLGINNSGLFYALGDFNPSYIIYGNINDAAHSYSKIEIESKIQAKSQFFKTLNNYFFINRQQNIMLFKTDYNRVESVDLFYKRPYMMIDALFISDNVMALLYKLNSNEYLLDLVDTNKQMLLYKTHIITQSIPRFIVGKTKKYLVYKEAGIIL